MNKRITRGSIPECLNENLIDPDDLFQLLDQAIDSEYARLEKTYSRSGRKRLGDKELSKHIEESFRHVKGVLKNADIVLDWDENDYSRSESRRKKALKNVAREASRLFSEETRDIPSIEEAIIRFESFPVKDDYDTLESVYNICAAAAIWILDELRRTNKIHDAYNYLPTSYDDIYSADIPVNIYDPSFDENLVRSVTYVIQNRDRASNSKWRVFLPHVHSSSKKAGGEAALNRQRFEGLLSLLDPERVRQAGEKLKKAEWEALRIYLEYRNLIDKDFKRLFRDLGIIRARKRPSVLMAGYGEQNTGDINKDIFKIKEKYSGIMESSYELDMHFDEYLQMDAAEAASRTGSNAIAKRIGNFETGNPFEMCFALVHLIDNDDDMPWIWSVGCSVMKLVSSMLPWGNSDALNIIKDINKDPDEDELEDWGEELFYNINRWLKHSGEPGNVNIYEKREDLGCSIAQAVCKLSGAVMPRDLHPFRKEREGLIEKGVNEGLVNEIISMSEILFLSQFQLSAENLNRDWWIEEDDEEDDNKENENENGSDTCTGQMVLDLTENVGSPAGNDNLTIKSEARGAFDADVMDTEPGESCEADWDPAKVTNRTTGGDERNGSRQDKLSETKDTEAEVKELRKEIKELKKILSETRRNAESDRAKMEKELRRLRMEHRELADLREIMFKHELEEEEKKEKGNEAGNKKKIGTGAETDTETHIETRIGTENGGDVKIKSDPATHYPYTVKLKTVIFGGHDTFIKNLAPLLDSVKYVRPGNNGFDPNIVKNADVVWIQSNYLSHAQFKKIAGLARQHNIQIRYFSSSAAEACAEQLIKAEAGRMDRLWRG